MIQICNIGKIIDGKKILSDINTTIKKNQITFIVGPSGAGKTTLLNIIGGILKPTSGTILYNDEQIEKNIVQYRAQNVGFIFQDYNLISGLNIIENIEIATEFAGVSLSKKEIEDRVKSVGIKDPYQKIDTLSGGEKQRTAIIRSVCKDANILIADEPTGSLDSENSENIFEMLRNMKSDKYIVIVSHDMEMAQKYADRIITIKDGTIVDDSVINNNPSVEKEVDNKICKADFNKRKVKHSICKLGLNSVKLRIGKIISIALVLALAISAITTVIKINRLGTDLVYDINVNYLENDMLSLYYNVTPNSEYMEYPFSDDDIRRINEKYSINDYVSIYIPDNHNLFF